MKIRKGFTLIELLVVIAIIGLLSTLAVISLNSARTKSRDAKRVSDIKQIQTALELSFTENSAYPTSVTSGGSIGSFMNLVPSNPGPNGSAYTYLPCSGPVADAYTCNSSVATPSSYTLTYTLEGAVGDVLAGTHTATPGGLANP